jgi:predicted small integral membrane protein
MIMPECAQTSTRGRAMNFGSLAIRLSKIVMTSGLAFWAFLVMLGNIVDYNSNLVFVQHVLTMDTVFADSTLRARAIADPALHTAAFVAIIITEGLASVAFLTATVAMAVAFKADTETFRRAKAWTAVGAALGFALWFVGFVGVASEWFVMWQSSSWNAQGTSFQIVLTVVAAGIYVLMDNDGA